MVDQKLKDFLDEKVRQYEQPAFIVEDPVSIPHLFSKREDIEIAGFFAAIFAWGKRSIIISKCKELMQLMENTPYDFIMHHSDDDLKKLLHFKHRTFNTTDLLYFIHFLKFHYQNHDSLETAFLLPSLDRNNLIETALVNFHQYFFSMEDFPVRTKKHIATPARNASCKRLNMYLRWMVRGGEVDFGLWRNILPSELVCPVDLHVARVARKLNLLNRKQTDWTAAIEVTDSLRRLDPLDPVKYDFALFGLGIFEKYY